MITTDQIVKMLLRRHETWTELRQDMERTIKTSEPSSEELFANARAYNRFDAKSIEICEIIEEIRRMTYCEERGIDPFPPPE